MIDGAATADRRDSRLDLPASLTSGRDARYFLRTILLAWDAGDLLDDAQLLTTELVNNAVVHASSAVRLRLRLTARCLRVEVTDNGTGVLHRQHSRLDDTRGRGLHLVEALSTSWGTAADRGGKVVWFELDRTDVPPPGGPETSPGPRQAPPWSG